MAKKHKNIFFYQLTNLYQFINYTLSTYGLMNSPCRLLHTLGISQHQDYSFEQFVAFLPFSVKAETLC